MNALRSAEALRHIRVPHIYIAPPRSTFSRAVALPQISPVRPDPHLLTSSSCSQSGFYLLPRPAPLHSRTFFHFTRREKSAPHHSTTPPTTSKEATPPAAPKTVVSNAEQRQRDWAIVRRLAVHIWPKNDWGTRGRVMLGVGLLVCGKVRLNILSARLVRLIPSIAVAERAGPALFQGDYRYTQRSS